jgi:hypothetical protein
MKSLKKESLITSQSGQLENNSGALAAMVLLVFTIAWFSGIVWQNFSDQMHFVDSQFEPICKKGNNNSLSGLHIATIAGSQSSLITASVVISKLPPRAKTTHCSELFYYKRLLAQSRSGMSLASSFGRPSHFLRI